MPDSSTAQRASGKGRGRGGKAAVASRASKKPSTKRGGSTSAKGGKSSKAKKPAAPKKQAAPAATGQNGKANGNGAHGAWQERQTILPVPARASRAERLNAEQRLANVDEVCAGWAAIVAERMAADQVFTDAYEQYETRPDDIRALFLWDALHAAETRVAIINNVIARHIDGRREADPVAILADLRAEQRVMAAAYAVNAFLAVLNQMSPKKPKWVAMEDLDPAFAVLALAQQTLAYAVEALRLPDPGDLTERVLRASQDQEVWDLRRDREAGSLTLAACAAAAAFFRELEADDLADLEDVAALYVQRQLSRQQGGI